MMMKLNKAGIDLIKSFESCRLKAYDDGGGVWTIGWGHTKGVKPGETITQEVADLTFRFEIAEFEFDVRCLVVPKLTENQFSALVSFAYNCGIGALKRSSLLSKVNAKDFTGAAEEFLKWVNVKGKPSKGLLRRRKAERELFLS
jgi:lysozyme